MAEVWVGRMRGTRGFSKVVALKLLLGELADDEEYQKMFLDEAELASRIRHANVAEILDLGEHEDVLFLVMEWVDGEPLQLLMREYRESIGIPYYLATRIGAQACAGLHLAHELKDDEGKPLGIVHRDVTPQNLLVTYDGVVKVVDFGVAKAASNLQKTSVGQTKGKAPYMSPEQARSDVVDRRTDVFALGIVLYQLTTSQHPFRGDNDLVTLRNILVDDPVVPPGDVVPGYPQALSDVIVKALQKNRDDRYATMMDMMEALELASLEFEQGREELGEFVTRLLGPRGEQRRAEINAAVAKSARKSEPELPSLTELEAAGAVPSISGVVPPAAPAPPVDAPQFGAPPSLPQPMSSPQPGGPPPPPRSGSSPQLGGRPPPPRPGSSPQLPRPASSPQLPRPASSPQMASPSFKAGQRPATTVLMQAPVTPPAAAAPVVQPAFAPPAQPQPAPAPYAPAPHAPAPHAPAPYTPPMPPAQPQPAPAPYAPAPYAPAPYAPAPYTPPAAAASQPQAATATPFTVQQQSNLQRQEQQFSVGQQFGASAASPQNPVATPMPDPSFPSAADLAPPMQKFPLSGALIIVGVALFFIALTYVLLTFML